MAAASAPRPASAFGLTDFRHDFDLPGEALPALLDLAQTVKQQPAPYASALHGRYLSLLFEKPSLRTRLTFELAIKQLGGDSIVQTGPIGDREPLKDVARNLDRWTDAIVARTFLQETIDALAEWSKVPVINALSDRFHPCQALADVLTLKEQFGRLRGLKLAFVGDGNNVAHSLMICCARLGVDCVVATPAGFGPAADIVAAAQEIARLHGSRIETSHDPQDAVIAANAVYTDVWTSMGQEEQAEERSRTFARYQVNSELMRGARQDAIFMHCLPAKRGEEVTEEVIESAQSVVFSQAENRLHAQKALLLTLIH